MKDIHELICNSQCFWEIFLYKPYVARGEAVLVQICKLSCIGAEIKGQLVGAERLRFYIICTVDAVYTIFSVAQQGIPNVGEVCAYLVSAPCDEVDFEQRKIFGAVFGDHCVFCDHSFVKAVFLIPYRDGFGFFVPAVVSFEDVVLFVRNADCNT